MSFFVSLASGVFYTVHYIFICEWQYPMKNIVRNINSAFSMLMHVVVFAKLGVPQKHTNMIFMETRQEQMFNTI